MKTIPPLRRILVSALVVMPLVACTAAPAPKIGNQALPDDRHGFVYGRVVVERNGQRVVSAINQKLDDPSVITHIGPFAGIDSLNTNIWKPGKWTFKSTLTDGGYFSAVLPVGRYYIVESIFFDVFSQVVGGRSYVSAGNVWTTRNRSVFVFDVLQGRATYVGTVLHTMRGRETGFEQQDVEWGTSVIDEAEPATQWFQQQYPRVSSTDTLLITKQTLD